MKLCKTCDFVSLSQERRRRKMEEIFYQSRPKGKIEFSGCVFILFLMAKKEEKYGISRK